MRYFYFLSALFLFFTFTRVNLFSSNEKELSFYTWEEYIDPRLIEEFEKTHNVKINFSFYNSDEERNQRLAQGETFDIVLSSSVPIKSYIKFGWVTKITENEVPNLQFFEDLDSYPWLKEYSVPYLSGTLGIAYRKDLIKKPIRSWADIFKPQNENHKKIIMLPGINDLLQSALKALNKSINSESLEDLIEAKSLLKNQKNYVLKYEDLDVQNDNHDLLTGKAHIAMMYSGSAAILESKNPNIKFLLPEEGSTKWMDFLVVMEASHKKELAFRFINFLSDPKNSAINSEYSMHRTPNLKSRKFLPQKILNNQTIYPPNNPKVESATPVSLKTRLRKKTIAVSLFDE